MKKITILLLFSVVATCSIWSQHLEVGLRDNQFAHADYRSGHGWLIGYEQSLLNIKMKEQNGRAFAGYAYEKKWFSLCGSLYYGSEYTGKWKNYGLLAISNCQWNGLAIGFSFNPHYDSALDLKFCYQAEAKATILSLKNKNENISLCAAYGNIPEYRMAVKYLRVGMLFTSGILWVKPMLCIPHLDQENGGKNIRVLCSFGWKIEI